MPTDQARENGGIRKRKYEDMVSQTDRGGVTALCLPDGFQRGVQGEQIASLG